MSNLNERIEKARRELFENIANRKNPGHPANLGDVMNHIDDALRGLKEPEPVEKEPKQPVVRNPEGAVWMFGKDSEDRLPFGSYAIHLMKSGCDQSCCRLATPAEAFRPGALVRWDFTKKDLVGHIEGEIQETDWSANGKQLLMIRMPGLHNQYIHAEYLTLVKPAPDHNHD